MLYIKHKNYSIQTACDVLRLYIARQSIIDEASLQYGVTNNLLNATQSNIYYDACNFNAKYKHKDYFESALYIVMTRRTSKKKTELDYYKSKGFNVCNSTFFDVYLDILRKYGGYEIDME